MKNKKLYDKTISILVKAYLDDTLERGNCAACAVGNIIAANMGKKYIQNNMLKRLDWDNERPQWQSVFMTRDGEQEVRVINLAVNESSLEQINSTGYTWQDLAKMEFAFETSHEIEKICKEKMYEGLCAVVEVLGEIHEVSKETTEETKLMFVKV